MRVRWISMTSHQIAHGLTHGEIDEANPLPPDLRALPLADPDIEHTIGLVTAAGVERAPVVSELLALFTPLELDRAA